MKKTILFALISLIVIGCNNAPKDAISYIEIPNTKAIDSVMQTFIDRECYPFIYTRLEDKNGEVIYEKTVKNNRLLENNTIDGNTYIRVWSMSKIITICIALDLMEDSLLSLNDPVVKYIPEFSNLHVATAADSSVLVENDWYSIDSTRKDPCPLLLIPNDSTMTILHLLNHQAGFYYSTTNIPCLDSMIADQNVAGAENSQDLIHRLAKLPLIQHSATKYYYGTNTTVLGLVAERATGKTLAQLVKERITEPMQITGIGYDLPEDEKMLPRFTGKDSLLRIAELQELDIFGQDVPDYVAEHELYLGGEGMICTTDGYCDFLRMLLNNGELNGYRFLNESTIADLTAPHTLLENPYGHNGYNLWVSGDSTLLKGHGDAGLWIGGGYEGTHFWIDTNRQFVGTIMTQMFWVYDASYGYSKDNRIRGEIYRPWTKTPYKD